MYRHSQIAENLKSGGEKTPLSCLKYPTRIESKAPPIYIAVSPLEATWCAKTRAVVCSGQLASSRQQYPRPIAGTDIL